MKLGRAKEFVKRLAAKVRVLRGTTVKDLVNEDRLIPATDGHSVLYGATAFPGSENLVQTKIRTGLLPEHGGDDAGNRLGANSASNGVYARIGKRVLDVALVILTLPVSVPLVLLFALALFVESGQPFYQQKRVGRGGREFSIWKLRTMVRDADARLATLLDSDIKLRAEWNATQKLKNDPRITPVGRFLRATSLDEVPQLFNVLLGDMSLVGPRPMLPDQLPLYGNPKAYFALRPGLTGLWQVSDRNESYFSYRSVLDRQYLKTLSIWQDLAIMLRTVSVVLRRTGY